MIKETVTARAAIKTQRKAMGLSQAGPESCGGRSGVTGGYGSHPLPAQSQGQVLRLVQQPDQRRHSHPTDCAPSHEESTSSGGIASLSPSDCGREDHLELSPIVERKPGQLPGQLPFTCYSPIRDPPTTAQIEHAGREASWRLVGPDEIRRQVARLWAVGGLVGGYRPAKRW